MRSLPGFVATVSRQCEKHLWGATSLSLYTMAGRHGETICDKSSPAPEKEIRVLCVFEQVDLGGYP